MTSRIANVGIALACLAAGMAVGLVGGFVQAMRVVVDAPWGIIAIPWGFLLVLIVMVVVVRGASWALESRAGGFLALAGWLLLTLLLASQSGRGDVVIAAGARQWMYLLGGSVLGAAVATLPLRMTGERT